MIVNLSRLSAANLLRAALRGISNCTRLRPRHRFIPALYATSSFPSRRFELFERAPMPNPIASWVTPICRRTNFRWLPSRPTNWGEPAISTPAVPNTGWGFPVPNGAIFSSRSTRGYSSSEKSTAASNSSSGLEKTRFNKFLGNFFKPLAKRIDRFAADAQAGRLLMPAELKKQIRATPKCVVEMKRGNAPARAFSLVAVQVNENDGGGNASRQAWRQRFR